ncbi:MAG: YigZ family protein [Clostridia bacterium]|nr:YigZ family protein [Clostridia bacterium]
MLLKKVGITGEHITIRKEAKSEYREKHSRFLGFILPCKNEKQAADIINAKKKEYWDARHAVYAYVLSDGKERFSDDGEPHGTAGKPVLDILKSSGIKDAVIVVVRYFGGILLGTGGLVRAYSAAALSAVENSEKVRIVPADKFSVSVGYGDYDKLSFLLKAEGADILSCDFSDSVNVVFAVRSDKAESLMNSISSAFSSSCMPKLEEKTEMYEKI